MSVFLAVGSNLGDRQRNIESAMGLLRATGGVQVLRVSSLIETEPVGGCPQGRYLNGAIEILTSLEPANLLAELHRIEAALGRTRRERYGPRTIDLDILLYGDGTVRAPGLEVPHPRMLERSFVLEPLLEIAPRKLHPVTGKTVAEHCRALRLAEFPAGPSAGGSA